MDDRAQRLLAGHRGSGPSREQTEPVVEPLGDLRDGERPGASRGELDRQRQTVKPLTDFADDSPRRLIGYEGRIDAGRACDEELARIRLGERRDGPYGLARHAQRFATRGEDVDSIAGGEELFGDPSGRVDEMLAVVEDQEQLLVRAVPAHTRQRIHVALGKVEHRGDCVRHCEGVTNRGELDEQHSVVPLLDVGTSRLDREPGLSGPTGTDQRDEATARHELDQLADLALATNERGERRREVGARPPGLQRHHRETEAGRDQRGVLVQDRGFERLQRGAGVEAELLGEHLAGVPVDTERVRLAVRAVQRQHQLTARALAQRVGLDEGFEVIHQLDVPAEGQRRVDALLGRAELELQQPHDVGLREFVVGEVDEHRPAPQRLGGLEPLHCGLEIPACGRPSPGRNFRLEAECVNLLRIEGEHVAGRSHHDDLGRAERLAQLRDHPLERVGHSGRRIVVPEPLD